MSNINRIIIVMAVVTVGVAGFYAGGYSRYAASPANVPEKQYYDWGYGNCVRTNGILYALVPGWVTSDALIRFENDGPSAKLLVGANSVYLIASGQYAGKLMVSQHRYYDDQPGSYDHYFIIDEDGKQLAEFGEELPDMSYSNERCR